MTTHEPMHVSGHSPLSTQSHLSPRLLTPDTDPDAHAPILAKEGGLTFVKQPLPKPNATSAMTSGERRSSSLSRRGIRTSLVHTDTDGLSDEPLSGLSSGFPDTPRTGSPGKAGHLSLLTALLSSPEHQAVSKAKPDLHMLSSVPSTALSSPTSHHITLAPPREEKSKAKPCGILRRGSVSAVSDAGMSGTEGLGPAFALTQARNTGLSVGTTKLLESKLSQVEKRERIGWADDVRQPEINLARAPSTGSSRCLKFAVTAKPAHGSASEADASRRSSASHRPSSPFAKERKVQESMNEDSGSEEEEEEGAELEAEEERDASEEESPANLPGYVPRPAEEEDEASDDGYQEDEEDGMFSDEEETTGVDLDRIKPKRFAFARSTNYWNRRDSRDDTSPGTSPPPAPTFIPPPNRRGRGHIRVADPVVEGQEAKKCTRHCSPPPRSRSNTGSQAKLEIPLLEAPPPAASPSARRMKRPFDRPIRKGKMAGSPMPARIPTDDEDEEEDDEVEEMKESATPPVPRGGWRSDDAVFYGPKSRVNRPPSRDVSDKQVAPPISAAAVPVFSETDEDSTVASGAGVKGYIRRASEHLPLFRRPSVPRQPSDTDSKVSATPIAPIAIGTCRPVLDDTPALASSAPRAADGGLAHRLEKTLGSSQQLMPGSAALSRVSTVSRPSTAASRDSSRASDSSPTPIQAPAAATVPAPIVNGTRQPSSALGRTVSQTSGKVTFAESAHRRAVSQAMGEEIVAEAERRRETREQHGSVSAASGLQPGGQVGQKSVPIKCPKIVQREDLGWTEGALLNIRKNAGKGER